MKTYLSSTEALIGVIEETVIEVESAGMGIVKILFDEKLSVINSFLSRYTYERFKKRLKYFSEAELNMTEEDIKKFFSKINSTKKDMLIKIFNDANDATYDIHAYILSQIYKKYIKNDKLDFFDHLLINNLDIFTEPDFTIYYDILSKFSKPDLLDTNYSISEEYYSNELRSVIYRLISFSFLAAYSQGAKSIALGSKENIKQYLCHTNASIELYKYISDFKKRN